MKVLIGIDPGVNTGIGYRHSPDGKYAFSLTIHKAMDFVKQQNKVSGKIFVRVEDARQRKWFGKNSKAKAQGAGSIKRDCKIWEDFLKDYNIPHEMIHPVKGSTKLNAKVFKQITGIPSRTNQHNRDAYMLIHGLSFNRCE